MRSGGQEGPWLHLDLCIEHGDNGVSVDANIRDDNGSGSEDTEVTGEETDEEESDGEGDDDNDSRNGGDLDEDPWLVYMINLEREENDELNNSNTSFPEDDDDGKMIKY
ncbi:hypothetical protein LguiB_005882 [Lonicera macranthoides]